MKLQGTISRNAEAEQLDSKFGRRRLQSIKAIVIVIVMLCLAFGIYLFIDQVKKDESIAEQAITNTVSDVQGTTALGDDEDLIFSKGFILSTDFNTSTMVEGTVLVFESNNGAVNCQMKADFVIDPDDWVGICLYFPQKVTLLNIDCTYQDDSTHDSLNGDDYITILPVGDQNQLIRGTVIGIASRLDTETPTGGGSGTIVIDFAISESDFNVEDVLVVGSGSVNESTESLLSPWTAFSFINLESQYNEAPQLRTGTSEGNLPPFLCSNVSRESLVSAIEAQMKRAEHIVGAFSLIDSPTETDVATIERNEFKLQEFKVLLEGASLVGINDSEALYALYDTYSRLITMRQTVPFVAPALP